MVDINFVIGVVVNDDVLVICDRGGYICWIGSFDGNVSRFIAI